MRPPVCNNFFQLLKSPFFENENEMVHPVVLSEDGKSCLIIAWWVMI